jgi:GT2 family glycosyltransferase
MSINNLTVVITTFKSNEKIKNCLRTIDNKCKVLVIENSKDSQFKESIEEEFENVECILSGANLGYGKANNIGLKKVKTKYALILNPDTRLDSLAIENFFKAANKIPDFAIMAPYIQEKKNKNDQNYLKNVSALEVENVKGFAMFLNLSNFEDENFFDENFFFYFEEIDLCRRLKMKNKKIYLIPNIIIDHDGGASHNELIKKEMELSRNWHWMWSTFYYNKKYKGFLISFMIVFPKLSSALLKVLIYSLIFNKFKKQIYYQRLSGLINSILGKSSWYRPKV